MKKTIYSLATIAILFISCSSDSDSIETALDNNLPAISSKLEKLELQKIQEKTEDLNTGPTSESFTGKVQQAKTMNFSINDDCSHSETINESYNGETIEGTIKYFNSKGDETTQCEIGLDPSNADYITKEEITITGDKYQYDLSYVTKNKYSVKINSNHTSGSFTSSSESEVTGTLDYDGTVFSITDGSYQKASITMNFSQNTDFSQEIPIKLTALYKIEFDAETETYHFDMKITEKDVLALENNANTKLEYSLFNSANQKIGTVKYVYNSNTEAETFELYDLDGNKI